jgi:hypothetical protein
MPRGVCKFIPIKNSIKVVMRAGRSVGRSLAWRARGLGFKSRPVHHVRKGKGSAPDPEDYGHEKSFFDGKEDRVRGYWFYCSSKNR